MSKLRQLREQQVQAAREAIPTGSVKCIKKYFVSLPTEKAHEGHPVSQ